MSIYTKANVNVSGRIFIGDIADWLPNGLLVSFYPTPDFVGSLSLLKDVGNLSTGSVFQNLGFTDFVTGVAFPAGTVVIVDTAGPPAPVQRMILLTDSSLPCPLYVTGTVTAGSVQVTTLPAPALNPITISQVQITATTTATSVAAAAIAATPPPPLLLSNLIVDNVPASFPEDLAFWFELAREGSGFTIDAPGT